MRWGESSQNGEALCTRAWAGFNAPHLCRPRPVAPPRTPGGPCTVTEQDGARGGQPAIVLRLAGGPIPLRPRQRPVGGAWATKQNYCAGLAAGHTGRQEYRGGASRGGPLLSVRKMRGWPKRTLRGDCAHRGLGAAASSSGPGSPPSATSALVGGSELRTGSDPYPQHCSVQNTQL